MDTLPPAFASRLRRLAVLDLSNNHFTYIPPAVAKIPTLQELNLSKNKDLHLMIRDVETLKSLENLHLLQLVKGYNEDWEEYTWSGACMRIIQLIAKACPDLNVKV